MNNIDRPIEGPTWTFTYWIPNEDAAGTPIVPVCENGILCIQQDNRAAVEVPISTLRRVLKEYNKIPLKRLRIVSRSIFTKEKKE